MRYKFSRKQPARIGGACNDGIPGTGAAAGDTLQNLPHWNAAGTAGYSTPPGRDLSGLGLLNASQFSGSHALYDRTGPFYPKKGCTLVNLRVGVRTRSGREAAVCVSNLLNRIGETALPTARRHAVTQPRTVGFSLNMRDWKTGAASLTRKDEPATSPASIDKEGEAPWPASAISPSDRTGSTRPRRSTTRCSPRSA